MGFGIRHSVTSNLQVFGLNPAKQKGSEGRYWEVHTTRSTPPVLHVVVDILREKSVVVKFKSQHIDLKLVRFQKTAF